MYNAIVIDDEADARNVMRRLIELFCPEITNVAEAADGAEAQRMIQQRRYDLAFVDIQLNGESGIDLARELSRHCANIIFVTAFDDYAVEAFQTQALHYLLKPVDPELLQQAVARAQLDRQRHSELDNRILLNTKTKVTVLRYEEIHCVSGEGNYCTFRTAAEPEILVSHNLSYYEKQLASPLFLRIHQSHLVNLSFVEGVVNLPGTSNVAAELPGGLRLPVARSRKKRFLAALRGG